MIPPGDVSVAPQVIAATLPEAIRAAAAAHGDREFLVRGERRVTFREAEEQSAALALGLLRLGVGKGARVGLLMPNTPDWPICWFGAARTGALTVALSTFYAARELDWALRHNDIDTLLITAGYLKNDYVERLERAIPGLASQETPELVLPSHPYLRRIIVWGPCDRRWALKGPGALLAAAAERSGLDADFLVRVEREITPADGLITICTSGSTAEPKAVVHSHGGVMRAVRQFLPYYGFRADDRLYSGHPFFWIGGLNVNLLPALFTGAAQICAPSPAAADIARVIARERVTRLAVWPAQAADIVAAANREGLDLSAVRVGLGPPKDEAGEVIVRERRHGGVFGMTESFGMHSLEPLNQPAAPGKSGSHGRALPGLDRRIVDPATGEVLPAGRTGELQIRGPTLMQGYYRRERGDVFTEDGYFATGDLGALDEDGYFYFAGRASEMIKTAGANVSPREVELALLRQPGVSEAFVVGLPDPLLGEMVVAVLVATDDRALAIDDLPAQLKAELSTYKVPKRMVVMARGEVPRTHSDKVDKVKLRSALATASP